MQISNATRAGEEINDVDDSLHRAASRTASCAGSETKNELNRCCARKIKLV